MDLINSNVFGLVSFPLISKSIYFVSFIDDNNRRTWFYFRRKSKIFNQFKEFRDCVENQTSKNCKCLRIDNNGEFWLADLDIFFK